MLENTPLRKAKMKAIDTESRLRRLAGKVSDWNFTTFCNVVKGCRDICEGTDLSQLIDDRGTITCFGDLRREVEKVRCSVEFQEFIEALARTVGVGPRQIDDDRFLAKLVDPTDRWTDPVDDPTDDWSGCIGSPSVANAQCAPN